MTTLLLQPHSDDAVLFACYTLLRERPDVITCLSDGDSRENEDAWAFISLGLYNFRSWPGQTERSHDLPTISLYLGAWVEKYEKVFAPAVEVDGHVHHSMIGQAARDVFGAENVTHYMTYRRGFSRSQSDTEVIPEPGWVALKMRAMACYTSQIENPLTRPWFTGECGDWSREFIQ